MDTKCELIWNIAGHGDQVELTLKWLPRGSKWENPFAEEPIISHKKKSSSCRKRDANRKKWFIVRKNSKEVSTEDLDNNNEETSSEGTACPISAPEHNTGELHAMHDKKQAGASEPDHEQIKAPFIDTDSLDTQNNLSGTNNNDTGLKHDNMLESKCNDFILFKKATVDRWKSCVFVRTVD